MVTQRVDAREVERLLSRGLYSRQIAEELKEQGFSITASGVRDITWRHGLSGERLTHTEAFPWPGLTARHHGSYVAAMLRLLVREKHGEEIKESMAKKLRSFKSARTKADEVVWFDPDAPTGFVYLDRQPEDEPGWLIRTPETMDQIRKRLADA